MNDDEFRSRFEAALAGEALGESFLHRLLGLNIVADANSSTVEFQLDSHFLNRRGILHGGIAALLFDVAMGNLHRAALGPGVTVEMKVQYLAAAESGPMVCRARFLKEGRQISFVEATLMDARERLVAVSTATFARAPMANGRSGEAESPDTSNSDQFS